MMNPSTLQCPSCSRVVYFSHEKTTLMPCACGTVVMRRKDGSVAPKACLIVQEPDDPIQPGTIGTWEERAFKVLGRFRAWYEESVYNYWTIVFDDGEWSYLGEGYGLYAILRKIPEEDLISTLKIAAAKHGEKHELVSGPTFILEKKSICNRWEIEGEVLFPEKASGFTNFEFSSKTGRQVSVFQFSPEDIQPYDLLFTSWSSLQLKQTREVERKGKTFTCNGCSSEIVVKTYPYAQSCACAQCGIHYALKDGNFKNTDKRRQVDTGSDIVMGSTGIVKGIMYQVIGFALKEENNTYRSQWKEYTLYNREEGYAFLSEYSGHWTYVREQGPAPVLERASDQKLDYQDEPFQLYNNYKFIIVNAAGEFPYNAFNSEDTHVKEFISPPEVWIQEFNKREGIFWFLGTHLSQKELRGQFDFPEGLPAKTGVGAVEPRGFISPDKLLRVSLVAIAFLVLLHLLIGFTKEERVIHDQGYAFMDSSNALTTVTSLFHLQKWSSNLQVDINAPVQNNWFELNATLVNAKTGTEYSLEKGVEYYQGFTDGENWTEGSTSATSYFTKIPAGDYLLQIQGIRGSNALPYFNLKVTYDVASHRNLWFCLLFLVLWPVLKYFRTNYIEKKRWYNSPFSPYTYEH